MNKSEIIKEYNKKYYAENKERISAMLLEKVLCQHCGRTVNHQNLHKHQSTKLCLSRRVNNTSNESINELIKKLQDKLI
jgi:hypothetical protein